MVSIAESFNYRIFERKRRMGEALHGSSPCMPHSQCRTKKIQWKFIFHLGEQTKRESFCMGVVGDYFFPRDPRRCSLYAERVFLSPYLYQPLKKHNKNKTPTFSLCVSFTQIFMFTDLSAAGLPAELKHITQRRKRKQP